VREACCARSAGEPERYPELAARRAVRTERWTSVVSLDRSKTRVSMQPRTEARWHGMLVPLLVEARGDDPRIRDITEQLDAAKSCGTVRHVLTHAAMEIEVFSGVTRSKSTRGPEWVPIAELGARAVPKVTREILRAAGIE
jgi:adenine-specific DNA glycosylase